MDGGLCSPVSVIYCNLVILERSRRTLQLNVGDDDYGKLVHIVSDQNRFVANYIKFEPHIIGELVEVTKLSDIVGYWYLPPGVLFSGSETPERSTNLEVMVAQVVDNEQVKLWELGIDPGTLRYPRARTIHTNDNLETFEGCWIRYPLVSAVLL